MSRDEVLKILKQFSRRRHIPDLHSGIFISETARVFVDCHESNDFNVMVYPYGEDRLSYNIISIDEVLKIVMSYKPYEIET